MFFYNNPATPEIYTLSLHDALPISTMAFHSSRLATGAQTRMAFTAKADLANKLDRVNDRYSPPTCDDARRDRKSTRLNSSHSSISYAVFCLKKKSRTTLTRLDRSGG